MFKNVLAEKQRELESCAKLLQETEMDEFQYYKVLEEYKALEDDFLKVYYQLRKLNEKRFEKITFEKRKKLHKLVLGAYMASNKFNGLSYEILSDKREDTDRPIIYVPTHVGMFDIQVISAAIKDHYYLLSGDYEHIQGTFHETFLGLNGVFYFNETVKEDRRAASNQMIDYLKNERGNLMYFIEGTWNLTPNLLMLPCYWGIVDVAKKGNAIISPIAAAQYGKHFKIKIGENFDMSHYGEGNKEKTRAITDLRDTLATLQWDICATNCTKRKEIASNEWDNYVAERFREWPYFNQEYIDSLVFKPKDVVKREEAYQFVKKMQPNKNNQFLYGKNLIDNMFDI